MPLPLAAAGIVAGIGAILRQVVGGVVIAGIFSWIKKAFTWVFVRKATGTSAGAAGKRGFFGKIYSFFEKILDGAVIFTVIGEAVKRIVGWVGVGGAVVSGGANVNQVWHLLENIGDPQTAVLDWLGDALSQLPSINQIIANLDAQISSMTVWQYVSPVPTITNMLQITGIGWAFNQLLMAAIQNMIFIFSVFIVRWAFAGNFTFTKSVNRKAKT